MNDTSMNSVSKWKGFNPFKGTFSLGFMGSFEGKPIKTGVPEVAFVGKSNVGKSSLLNKLKSFGGEAGDSARVGKTAGATRGVNFYELVKGGRRGLVFTDLPGFGYAKLSKEKKGEIEELAEVSGRRGRGEGQKVGAVEATAVYHNPL